MQVGTFRGTDHDIVSLNFFLYTQFYATILNVIFYVKSYNLKMIYDTFACILVSPLLLHAVLF